MATLRKRNGVYFIDYRINGNRIRKTVGPSRKTAGVTLKEIEVKIAKGQIGLDKESEKLQFLFDDFLSHTEISHLPKSYKTEAALQERAKMLTIFERMQDGITIINKEGTFLYANKAMANNLGYTREELLSLSMIALEAKENKAQYEKHYDDIIGSFKRPVFETLHRRKDGSMMNVLVSASVFDFKGEKVVCSICRDITGHKQSEEKIKHLNTILRVVRNVNQLIVQANDRSELSQHICDLLVQTRGYDYACIVLVKGNQEISHVSGAGSREGCSRIAHFAKEMNKLPACCQKAMLEPDAVSMQGRISICDDCAVLDQCSDSGVIIRRLESRGVIYGAISVSIAEGFVVDEMETSLFNEIAEDVAFALHDIELGEENERRLEDMREMELIVSKSPAVVFRWRASEGWPVEFVSDNVKQFGYVPKDFLSGRVSWVGITHADDVSRLEKEVVEYAQEGVMEFTQEYRIITKTGGMRWIEDRTRAIIDAKGNITHYQGIILDITKRKTAEEKLGKFHKDLITSNRKLKQMMLIDQHTGLYNHRYLEEIIESEFERAKRYDYPISMLMLDIDYFKSINELYGHHFGDLVLKQFAVYLKEKFRKYDVVGRFGGEEFIIISPCTDKGTIMKVAQRTLEDINVRKFGNKDHNVKLKLSMGISSYPEDNTIKGIDLVGLAEKNMNRAKQDGGNRVYDSEGMTEIMEMVRGRKEGDILLTKLDDLTKRSNQSLTESIFAFAKTIELKDNYTGEHVEETVRFATDIARAMDLSIEEVERIRQASMLHDLGKIGISEKILLKEGSLTDAEFEEIKRHPQIAADILRPIQFLRDIIPLIFYHHEKWDGTGYPSGLKGEEIPLGARIIAVADVYQALVSDRPYRKAYSKEKVMDILKSSSGTHFEPRIVDLFLNILSE